MLYLFYGTDTKKCAQKLHATIEQIRSKNKDASYIVVGEGKLTRDIINEATSSMGLFVHKIIAKIEFPFMYSETKEILLESIKEMAESDNVFFIHEGQLTKEMLKPFQKYADKIFEHAQTEQKIKKTQNPFALADAIGERNKKKSFALVHTELKQGVSPEEIHGRIWWIVKSMFITTITKTAEESDMKAFTYTKSKRCATHYSKTELKSMLTELVLMPHTAHNGESNFEHELLKFVLRL